MTILGKFFVFAALVFCAVPGAHADCVQNLYHGRMECGPGKCVYNRYHGEVQCANSPSGGAAYDEYHATIQCGVGNCEYDFYHADIKCSSQPGGWAYYDAYNAVITCSGSCDAGSTSLCQSGQPQ